MKPIIKYLALGLFLTACLSASLANNVQITNMTYDDATNVVTFDISWENSWRSGTDFHDAVWVFVKYSPNNSDTWSHADLSSAPGALSAGASLELVTQSDNKGVFIRNSISFSGNVAATSISLTLATLNGPFPDIKVFGVEMVYVPEGAFYLGDGTSTASYGTYSTSLGNIDGSYFVANSGEINVGSTDGYLYTLSGTNLPVANIPAAFPNGFDAFYCMKYEISQEQYKEFLNCLDRTQQNARTFTDISGTSITNIFVMRGSFNPGFRNGIRCETTLPSSGSITFYNDLDNDGIFDESTDGQGIAANNINPDDLLSYLDWAAFRPMTGLEFEKACRGTNPVITGEYAWGSTDLTEALTITNSGLESEGVSELGNGLTNFNGLSLIGGPLRNGFAATSTTTRSQSGSSFYGIMELSGNVSELVVPLNNTGASLLGLSFDGTLGDGEIDINGNENAWSPQFYRLRRRGGNNLDTSDFLRISNRSGFISTSTGFDSKNGGRGVR